VGLPLPSRPLTVTAYVVSGASPDTVQSVVGQDAVTGLPPPTGTAVTVYGPPVPGAGDTCTPTLPAPVACTSATGEPAAGVVTTAVVEPGVAAPLGVVPAVVTA
jgi:hypothetical protein